MPAPLEGFLRAIVSGNNVMTQEVLDAFGGESILEQLRKFDPDARLVESRITQGGEAGWGGENAPDGVKGYRLEFDWSKLPKSQAGSDWSINPADHRGGNLIDKGAVYDDPVYGKVTNSSNLRPDQEALWTKLAPIAVSMLAPMAGGALAGMGIGGTAGLTAAATGSGLGSAASSIPSWAVQIIKNSPSLAKQIANGADWKQVLLSQAMGPASNAVGIDPRIIKAGLTLAQLARRP